MRDQLVPLNAVLVETELGAIYLTPRGTRGIRVNAPHLTMNGVPLQPSAFLVSGGQGSDFNFIQILDTRTGISSTPPHSLQARLVNGHAADIVVFGKLAQVIVPAVRKLAEQNWSLFLEAEGRNSQCCGVDSGLSGRSLVVGDFFGAAFRGRTVI
jgi:hypothetical protein